MHLNEKVVLDIKRTDPSLAKKIEIRADGIDVHAWEWRKLSDNRSAIMKAASANFDKIKDSSSDTELRAMESAHDGLMEIVDEIDAEKDHRTKIGDRAARSEEGRSNPARPISNSRAAGSAVAEYTGEFDEDGEARDGETATFALRSGQSFTDHVRETRMRTGRAFPEYRGLTEGAYLRALVTGAKTDVEKRALAEGSDSAGGYTVPEILSARMIDRLRAASVVFRAGAQTVPLTSDKTNIAKVATDPTPGWRNENAAVAESDPTFSNVPLIPRSLMVMVKVSRELLEDSVNIEAVLPQIIAEGMAAEVDRVALMGSGSAPEPRGVVNFSGLTTATSGGVISVGKYGPIIRARTALRTANTDMTAVIMHPRDEGALAELTDSTGQPLQVPRALENVPFLTTTKLPIDLGTGDNESNMLAGDWRRLMIGFRNTLRIEILRERYADYHQYAFVAHLRADVAAEHEKAFTLITGNTI